MTLEKKVYRLERVLKFALMIGRRLRSELRQQGEKIDMAIDAQIKTEEKLASLAAKNETDFAELASLQQNTARQVDDLIRMMRRHRQ